MAHQFTGLSTADIYQSIIDEVFKDVKDAFIEDASSRMDGSDVHEQFKQGWERAVEQAITFDRKPQKPTSFTAVPPEQRATGSTSRIVLDVPEEFPSPNMPISTGSGESFHGQQSLSHEQLQFEQYGVQQQMHYVTEDGVPFQDLGGEVAQPQADQLQQGQQHYYHQEYMPQGVPMGGQQEQLDLFDQGTDYGYVGQFAPPNQEAHSDDHAPSMVQLDGNSGREHASADKKRTKKTGDIRIKRKDAERALKQLMQLQLDGGGAFSDSSDEEYIEDDGDEQLERVLEQVGGGRRGDSDEEDGEEHTAEDGAGDDASLNSADDEDDGDLESIFDVNNTIVCQYEKVHRTRNKWKLNLKNGIMHIDGHDYCFQKAVGDTEF